MASDTAVKPAKIIGEGSIHAIALHGWMGDHHLFEPTYPHWDRQKVTVAFMDCRGYGDRSGDVGEYTIEEVAKDVRALAESLGWKRYHVIGHSMTGMTAQRLAVDATEEIESIVLVAALTAAGAKITEERRQLLLGAIESPETRKQLIDVNTGSTNSDEWLTTLRDLSLAGTSSAPLSAYMSSWTTTDFSSEVVGNGVPVLVVHGGKDPGTSVAKTEETVSQWFKDVTIKVIDGAGHYPMYETPEEFAIVLQGHLSRF